MTTMQQQEAIEALFRPAVAPCAIFSDGDILQGVFHEPYMVHTTEGFRAACEHFGIALDDDDDPYDRLNQSHHWLFTAADLAAIILNDTLNGECPPPEMVGVLRALLASH